jgi:hypothetical protein
VYNLLEYICTSDDHNKYLDNVNHPAKKTRKNVEIVAELKMAAGECEPEEEGAEVPAMTNSNKLAQRIIQLNNSPDMVKMKEEEFRSLVTWVTGIQKKVDDHIPKQDI